MSLQSVAVSVWWTTRGSIELRENDNKMIKRLCKHIWITLKMFPAFSHPLPLLHTPGSRLPLPPQELLFLFVLRSFFPSALLKEDNLIAASVDSSANDYGVTTAIAVLCRVVCRNPFSHSCFFPGCSSFRFVLFAFHFISFCAIPFSCVACYY